MTARRTKTSSVRSSRTGPRDEERVYAALKESLLSGTYIGGERIVVEELAAAHEVSRQPVYDALRRLSAEGFVEILPQVGCRVRRHDLAEVADFFELFAAVERAATELAAARLSDDDLAVLRRLNAQIGGLINLTDPSERVKGYFLLNRELHTTIHRAAGTPIVDAIGSSFYDRADFMINGACPTSPMTDGVASRHADHQRIIEALEARDAKAAGEAAQDHIRSLVPLIEATVRAYGSRTQAS